MTEISASLLSASFAHLLQDVNSVSDTDYLHVDVMDGQFVPNLTMGVPVIASLKAETEIPLDVHLMIQRPRLLLPTFCALQPDYLTIHLESDSFDGIHEALDIIGKAKVKKGLALRPITKAQGILPFLKDLDMVLVMTVEPGFGGQSFMESQLETIAEVKAMCQQHNPQCLIQVDGGINLQTAPLVKEAGADILVAGSAIFGAEDRQKAISALRQA